MTRKEKIQAGILVGVAVVVLVVAWAPTSEQQALHLRQQSELKQAEYELRLRVDQLNANGGSLCLWSAPNYVGDAIVWHVVGSYGVAVDIHGSLPEVLDCANKIGNPDPIPVSR